MVVTTPIVTVTKVERDSGGGFVTLTANTTPLSNTWGDFLTMINQPSDVHDELLVLHCTDDGGSAIWDTDDYRITFSCTNSSGQTKDKFILSKIFNNETIPTTEPAWGASNVATIAFLSGDLDDNPDSVQNISGVAILDASEWESAGNKIFGFKIMMIDAMPTVTLTSMPTSGSFDNDVISFDVGDAGDTVTVEPHHSNYDRARIFDNLDAQQGGDQTGTTFNITLTNGWYFILYVDRPFDNSKTTVASRRINMTQN